MIPYYQFLYNNTSINRPLFNIKYYNMYFERPYNSCINYILYLYQEI